MLEEGYSTRYWRGAFESLAQRELQVVFGTLRERRELHDEAAELGFTTFALDCRTSLDYVRAARKIASIIRSHEIDVVHLNEAIQATVGGAGALMARRGRRVFHRHHTIIEGSHRFYTRNATRLSHLTMAISQAVADQTIREGVPAERVVVAHNGVAPLRAPEPSELEALRARLDIAPGDLVVVIVGLIRPEKGQETAIDAMTMLADGLRDRTHLLVVGDEPARVRDPLRQEGSGLLALRRRARERGLDRVHFVAHQADVAPWLHVADVAAAPSRRDAFGLVAVEAMACSKPVVASAVEGLAEVVHDETTGLLVPPDDAPSLAAALSSVLGDPQRRRGLGDAGAARYREHFTMDAMVDRWISCYERVLSA